VSVLDVSSGLAAPLTIRRETQSATSVAFSPDGQLLAVARWDGLVELINEQTGRRQTLRPAKASSLQTALAFDSAGRRLAYGTGSLYPHRATVTGLGEAFNPVWQVGCWGVATLSLTTSPQLAASTHAVAFSPDGAWLASAHADCSVYLWDLGKRIIKLEWHIGAVRSLAFSPDGELLATGSADGTVKLWPWRHLLSAGRS
jgi:WD40 repeat protein